MPHLRPRRLLAFRLVVTVLDALLAVVARRDYRIPPLPRTGPLLVAPNHLSLLDPVAVGVAVVRAGRTPRFVVAAEVMARPAVGRVLRYFDHIPLDRGRPLDPAVLEGVRAALRRGECVVFYPEGQVTRDPEYRPGRGLPGLGRLAVEFQAPIVPLAQWGAQYVVGRGTLAWRRWPPRRALVTVTGLPPIVPPPGPATTLPARRLVNQVMADLAVGVERLADPDVGIPGDPSTGFVPRAAASSYRRLGILPRRIQAWCEANEPPEDMTTLETR